MRAAIWSPCASAPEETRIGPFLLSALRDCPIPAGKYPLIVISHGFGGTFFSHRDTAAALAEAGFIVVAINHPGDNAINLEREGERFALTRRPSDTTRLLDYMLTSWAEAASIDAMRIGVFGFSRGGYTALVLAGGVADFARVKLPCPPEATAACAQMLEKIIASKQASADPRVKAVVVADPLNAFPDRNAVKNVGIPVQLWSSERGGDGVAPQDMVRLSDDLPAKPEYRTVQGAGHFSFIAPCPAEMENALPQICGDAPGFDRVTFHQAFNTDVVRFFRASLH